MSQLEQQARSAMVQVEYERDRVCAVVEGRPADRQTGRVFYRRPRNGNLNERRFGECEIRAGVATDSGLLFGNSQRRK